MIAENQGKQRWVVFGFPIFRTGVDVEDEEVARNMSLGCLRSIIGWQA
jgi:hypothetical protein